MTIIEHIQHCQRRIILQQTTQVYRSIHYCAVAMPGPLLVAYQTRSDVHRIIAVIAGVALPILMVLGMGGPRGMAQAIHHVVAVEGL